MKLKNFDKNHQVNFYTMLNSKKDVIYNNDFKVTKYVKESTLLYKITTVEYIDDIEYWEVKSIYDIQPIGWVKAKGRIKILSTITQKILTKSDNIKNDLNIYLN